MAWIDWPSEDIVLEICWNGDPDDCQVVAREFLPNPCCANCMKHKENGCVVGDGDLDDVCDRYEWDEDIENLRDEPRIPEREDYKTMKAYLKAKDAYQQWIWDYRPYG